MRAQMHDPAPTFLLIGMCTALLMFSGVASAQELTKIQQKCLNAANKGAAKIVKAQGKDICDCIKKGSKGQLIGTIEDCLTSDPKGKVTKAKSKYDSKAGNCDAGVIALADKEIVKQAAMDKDLALIHWIFGSDLDLVIADASIDKAKAKCQKAIAKAAFKCEDEKLKAYNKCKKDELKGKNGPAVMSAQELQDRCMGVGTGTIPDPKGKLAKCNQKMLDAINKKCTAPYDVCFPGCPGVTTALELKLCIDYMIECEVCRYLNTIDGLNRDCDLFDDGLANGSCTICGDGNLEVGEECDDGNNDDGDGCTSDCLVEFCGDGAVNDAPNEECDPPVSGTCPLGTFCNAACQCEGTTHKCVLPNGVLDIVTQAFTIPGVLVGGIDISFGEVDENGKAPCTCEIQSLDPFELPGIGFICLSPAGGCPVGEVDCDGGNGLDIDLVSDHNIGACTNNADCRTQCGAYCAGLGVGYVADGSGGACEGFCQGGVNADAPCTLDSDCLPGGDCSGNDGVPHGPICGCQCVSIGGGAPSRPGGLQCDMGTSINVEALAPCGDGDIIIVIGQSCIHLTTETSTAIIINTNNTPTKELPPGGASLLGTPANCAALDTSVTTGIVLRGYANFFDSTIGDLNTQVTVPCQ